MRTIHKATAIVAALGIALGVAACGTDTKPGALPITAPKASASLPPAATSTALPTQAPAALGSQVAMATDSALRADLKNMATLQEVYITDHPEELGVPLTAAEHSGHASVIGDNRFLSTPGNVIAVKVGPAGYCVSGYNKAATKATSVTKSMLYKSDQGGIQAAVGVC